MRSSMWIRFVGKKHSWKQLSLIGDETVISLQRAKVYVFSDSVLCLGRVHQHPGIQRSLERQGRMDHNFSKATKTLTEPEESGLNSSGTFSQDSPRCSSAVKSQIY